MDLSKLSTIKFSKEDRIGKIILNRPDRFNAMNHEMGLEILDLLEHLKDSDEVRVIIITGAGAAFCSGGDIKAMSNYEKDHPGETVSDFFKKMTIYLHSAISEIRRLNKIVIAAVNGPASGAGFSLALASDLVYAGSSAKFHQAYTKIGLVADGGSTYFLPRLVGFHKAAELCLLADLIDAQEAKRLGIVNDVFPDDRLMEEVEKVAKRIAQGASKAFARTKELLNRSLLESLETQMENERQGIIASSQTPDFREGIAAFLEKRPPKFS